MANAKKRLSRIQRLGCLGIMVVMHNTPAGAMEALTCPPPLELVVQGEARLAHIDPGVWDVGPTFTPVENTVVYLCGFSSWIPYLIWGSMLWDLHLIFNPNIGLLCWLEKSGPKDLGLLPQLRGSSSIQMGVRKQGEPGLESIDNLRKEGSASV